MCVRACVCVARARERDRSSAIIILYAKNSKVKRSVKERRNGDGCIKGNGVSGNHSFIICTPLKMATGGILLHYALMQHNKLKNPGCTFGQSYVEYVGTVVAVSGVVPQSCSVCIYTGC